MTLSIGCLPINNNADIILHPIKYKNSITYEPLAEEAVIALIVKELTYNIADNKTKEFFDEMDDGYLYSESNFDEFDIETIKNSLTDNNKLILGRDIYLHPKKENILKLANLLKLVNFEVDGIDDNNFDEIDELDTFDGAVVYVADGDENSIIVSPQFKIANKITTESIKVDGVSKNIILDENLKGVFGIIFEENYNQYPFKRVKIN